jgi:hypothetical protein
MNETCGGVGDASKGESGGFPAISSAVSGFKVSKKSGSRIPIAPRYVLQLSGRVAV